MNDIKQYILNNYIKPFAIEVNKGFGWISEENIIEQFSRMYPNLECELLNNDAFEKFIIKNVKKLTEVKKGEC